MEDIAESQAVKSEHACSCGAVSKSISKMKAHRSSAESMLDGSKHGSEPKSVEQNGKSCTEWCHKSEELTSLFPTLDLES